jgi:hypothetical protein
MLPVVLCYIASALCFVNTPCFPAASSPCNHGLEALLLFVLKVYIM